jgi:hypothetical protein
VTTRIVISQHNLLQRVYWTHNVLRHLKLSTRGHHWLVRCSCPSKWRDICSAMVSNYDKKHLQGNLFTRGTHHLLKPVALVLWRIIRENDQVKRLWSVFLRRFSVVSRNPHGGQTGNWVMSLTWQCGGRGVLRKRLSFRPYKLQLLQELKAQWSTTLERLLHRYAEPPQRGQFVFRKKIVLNSEATFHLPRKLNRHILNICGSQTQHQVVEHVRVCPKVNVVCAVSITEVYRTFLFTETIITGHVYLDMLENFLVHAKIVCCEAISLI